LASCLRANGSIREAPLLALPWEVEMAANLQKIYNFTVIFEPLEEGGYDVIVPAIPEICTFGDTLEQAKRMVKDAIKCYLESAIKRGEPIPEDRCPSIERIAVEISS